MPEKYRDEYERALGTGDFNSVTTPLFYVNDVKDKPKDLPDDAQYVGDSRWGFWLSNKGEPLSGVKLAEDPISRAVVTGKSKVQSVITPIIDKLMIDLPTDTVGVGAEIARAAGMQVPEGYENAAKEGARQAMSMGVSALVFGATRGQAGGAQLAPLFQAAFKQALAGFGVGVGVSGAMQAAMGPEMGLQSREEAKRDLYTTFGAGAGSRIPTLARAAKKAVSSAQFSKYLTGQARNWALVDKVTPGNFKAYTSLVNQLGRVPNAWWAGAGNIAGSVAGFKAATDESLASTAGIFSVLAPGIFVGHSMRKAGAIQARVGMKEGVTGHKGSYPEAAYEVTEFVDSMPAKERAEILASYAKERGVYNQTSSYGDGVNTTSTAMFLNDVSMQAKANLADDAGTAIGRASELVKQQSVLHFPNPLRHGDLLDFARSLELLGTKKIVPLKNPDFIGQTATKLTPLNPLVSELQGSLSVNSIEKVSLIERLLVSDETQVFLNAAQQMVADVARDVGGTKLHQFSQMLTQMKKAAIDIPQKASILNRTVEKLKHTFVNEGIFGAAYGTGKVGGPGDITDLEFDGQRILDYLVKSKDKLQTIFSPDELSSLNSMGKLMKGLQDTGLRVGTRQRNIERITNFSKYRMVFHFTSGAFIPGGANPLARTLLGTGSVYAGGKAWLLGANALFSMGTRNPRIMRKYVGAALSGDVIREKHFLRTLLREGNPEAAAQMGISSHEIEEQTGITSGLFGLHIPTRQPTQ